MKRIAAHVVIVVLAVATPAVAKYVQREILDVPLERLIRNLEAAVASHPEDPQLRHHMARTLAMAWARGLGTPSDVQAVERDPDALEPWFGYGETRAVPFAADAAGDPGGGERTAGYLQRAIESYEAGLALDPDSLRMRLGLAWCQEQADEREAAMAGYREVVERAWEQERERRSLLGSYVTSEAIGYLMPLLDPDADAAEIAELMARKEELSARPRAVTPIAIALTPGAGPDQLVRHEARVRFDLDATGRRLEWQWITPGAAWLVWDPGQRGSIDSALALFGSRSFSLFPVDGYAALALLDDDADGVLRERELSGLALWSDADGDGRSAPGEVRSLAAHGIRALSSRGRAHPSGIRYAPGGVELSDGRRLDTFDLVLEARSGRAEGDEPHR